MMGIFYIFIVVMVSWYLFKYILKRVHLLYVRILKIFIVDHAKNGGSVLL